MKVFRVKTERSDDTTKEIVEVTRFVTQASDSFLEVAKYFTVFCDEFDEELVSIDYDFTISEHIK